MNQLLRLAFSVLLAAAAMPASAQQNGLNFDGSSDYVTTTAGSLTSYTIECWVRFTGATTASQNIIVYTDNVGPSMNYSHQICTDASGHFRHYTYDGGPRNIYGTTVALLNTWYHVAISGSQNGTARLYVNGTQEGTPLAVTNIWPGGDRFHIGGTSALGGYFRGTMDELRIWSRELCSGEINSAMNGELLNPTTQSGLHRYYKFNQGTASGTNTSVTTATDNSINASNGTLQTFALTTGVTSNWVGGTGSITGTLGASYNGWDLMATTNLAATVGINGSTVASNCALISNLAPRTGVPLSGTVTARVMMDGSVQTFAGQPYVPRHYHIEPTTNPNTATATLTLYYTQADFTAYNAVRGSQPSLPTSTSDVANAANLRITQFHGVPTGGYAPQNYPRTWGGSGPAKVAITPSSVTYSTTYDRWEVVIPVTGFSGFFAGTGGGPLPVTLTGFSATLINGALVRLSWNTATAGKGETVEVERSTDGQRFSAIGSMPAERAGDYFYDDNSPLAGVTYYRLRFNGTGDAYSYSPVQSIRTGQRNSVSISPMPARDFLNIETDVSGLSGVLADMQGRVQLRFGLEPQTTLDLHQIPAGIYFLRLSDGTARKVVKE